MINVTGNNNVQEATDDGTAGNSEQEAMVNVDGSSGHDAEPEAGSKPSPTPKQKRISPPESWFGQQRRSRSRSPFSAAAAEAARIRNDKFYQDICASTPFDPSPSSPGSPPSDADSDSLRNQIRD